MHQMKLQSGCKFKQDVRWQHGTSLYTEISKPHLIHNMNTCIYKMSFIIKIKFLTVRTHTISHTWYKFKKKIAFIEGKCTKEKERMCNPPELTLSHCLPWPVFHQMTHHQDAPHTVVLGSGGQETSMQLCNIVETS